MSGLRGQFNEALKQGMFDKDQLTVATIRLILAALKDRDIAARSKGVSDGVTQEEILAMLQSMVKQRRDSIALYEQGGRLELAERERGEIKVIQTFLPEQMNKAETDKAVTALLSELNAASLKDLGRVMKELRDRYTGRMDFGSASELAKAKLTEMM